MNVVIYNNDLEPITIIHLPLHADWMKRAMRYGYVRVAVPPTRLWFKSGFNAHVVPGDTVSVRVFR